MRRSRGLVARFAGAIGVRELSQDEWVEGIAGLRAIEHASDFRPDEGTCSRYCATSREQTFQAGAFGNVACVAQRQGVRRLESKGRAQDDGQCLFTTGKGTTDCFDASYVERSRGRDETKRSAAARVPFGSGVEAGR